LLQVPEQKGSTHHRVGRRWLRTRIRRSDNEHGGADDRQAVVRSLAEHGVDVAFGIPGVRANSPAELEAAIIEASARNVPTIIDTPITWTY
jgi:thiamine pyrophosphate-dependent acetolactate synthase large subunit-like protein